jgi:tetratricopeptide (TPR) repeat protein
MSLLLEALKKAALEKRSRIEAQQSEPGGVLGKNYVPSGAPPRGKPEAQTSPAARDELESKAVAAPSQTVSKSAAAYVERQTDRHAAETRVSDFYLPEDAGEADTETKAAESAVVPEFADEENLDLDLSPELDADSESEAGSVETAVVETTEPEPASAYSGTPVPDIPPKMTLEMAHQSQPPQGTRSAPGLASDSVGESPSPARPAVAVTPLESAEDLAQRRVALGQLMERSREVARRSRRRGAFLYGALSLTVSGSIGIYYYYLTQDDFVGAPVVVNAEAAPSVLESVNQNADGGSVLATTQPGVATNKREAVAAPVSQAGTLSISMNNLSAGQFASAKPVAAEPEKQRLTMQKKSVPRPANQAVQDGYAAYKLGDMQAARAAYARALELAPANRDALLGAAAVAIQQSRWQDALRFYQTRLAEFPQDEYARAGLLALASQGVTDAGMISEIKLLIRDNPEAAHLHFLLGSMQAAAGDWRQAQPAFFDALYWDKRNADYAYNLAVAMDHIKQSAQARDYYRKSLALADGVSVNFDRSAVSKRLQQIDAVSP